MHSEKGDKADRNAAVRVRERQTERERGGGRKFIAMLKTTNKKRILFGDSVAAVNNSRN